MRFLYFLPHTAKNRVHPYYHHLRTLLDACPSRAHLAELHGRLIRAHLASDATVASRLVAFLASSAARHDMAYARKMFDQMPHPNVFVWNCMIRGYTNSNSPVDALALYKLMLQMGVWPDNYTMVAVVSACIAFAGSQATGDAVHAMVRKIGFESDMFVMSGLINLYGSGGCVESAREVFEEMRERDVVSWTSIVSAYAQCGRWGEAFRLLGAMQPAGIEPNKVTVISLLSACGQWQAVNKGRWVHSQIAEYGVGADVDVGNSLVSMYARCGCMSDALEAFWNMPVRNTKTWNALIDGLVQTGQHREALSTFEEMVSIGALPDEITLVSVLSASAQLGNLQQGKRLHTYIKDYRISCDTILRNSLINMYAKCGDIAAAEMIFQNMPDKDVVSWTAMICGYVQGHQFTEALNLFEEMKIANVEANEMTLVSLLCACSRLGALDKGRQIHSYIEEKNVRKDVFLESALVDMYAKCGCIDIAAQIFHVMPHKQTLSWNAMIGGLASNGNGKEALGLFNQMQNLKDAKPDGVTLKAVLSACAHAGMVDEGLYYFDAMSRSFNIVPDVEHCGCIVDLLSRAGLLDQAFDFIKKMPLEPNPLIWGSLLAACRVHHKMELGRRIAQHIVDLAPDDVGAHVLISLLYAEEGRWDDVQKVRALMGSKGIEKTPGCSSIKV